MTSAAQNIRRVSLTMPQPTLDSQGRPVNWQPTSVVDEEWGRLQVVVNNTDVTYWQGIPVQVPDVTFNDPFGDAHAEIVFPQLSGGTAESESAWLVDFAMVEINRVHPDGSVSNIWEGFFAAQKSEISETDYKSTLTCQGALYQVDLFQKQPFIGARWLLPQYATDLGALVADEINQRVYDGVLALQPLIAPSTGINDLRRGNWGKLLTGYIQDLLSKSTTPSPDPAVLTQWTLMKNPGRQPVMHLRDNATVNWSMWAGTPGISFDLGRELTMSPNVIYGSGIDPDTHCAWGNIKYPNLFADTAPVYPGNLFTIGYVGEINPNGVDTHGTTDVLEWKQRASQLGYAVDPTDNTYESSDAAACEQLQAAYGIAVDGVVGPQTWAATFDTGANGGDPYGAYYAPIAEDGEVEPYLYTASGAKTSSTPNNPAFRANQPGLMRVEKFEGPFQRTAKADAQASAANEIYRYYPNWWFGTMTLTTDPEEGSRFDIRAGHNVLLRWTPRTDGTHVDLVMHVAQASHDFNALRTTLTVDSRGRDLVTLNQIKARERDVFDPVGRQKPTYYSQRKSSQVQDIMPEFDCENGAGTIPYQGIYSRLWNVERIPFAEAGTIVRASVQNGNAAEMAMGIFDGRVRPTHQSLSSLGQPTDSDYWMSIPDDWGLIIAWGGAGQMMGYYPRLQSTGAPKTGVFADNASWYFESRYPPYLYVAIWCEATTYLAGNFEAQAAEST